VSAQTYKHPLALARLRAGTCPECGGTVESHGNDNRFWMPGNQGCSLLERGVRERIDWQRHLDGLTS
jgi:tRNA(Ile2) C34 agmatinyltransferase TiaS